MSSADIVIDNIFDDKFNKGTPTGFRELDHKLGGIKSGTVTVIGGGTGMGKSLFATQILVNLAKQGFKSMYFELENGLNITWKRLIQIWFGLPAEYFLVKENKEDALEKKHLIEEFISVWDYETLASWGANWDAKEGRNVVTQLIRVSAHKYKFFLIDPLQALETRLNSNELYQEQGNIMKQLQETANDKQVSVIICHHIRKNQASSKKVGGEFQLEEPDYIIPSIENLRGSGKIVDFAHSVWGLLRFKDSSSKEQRERTVVRVLKNRSGLSGDFWIRFDENTLSFREVFDYPSNDLGL